MQHQITFLRVLCFDYSDMLSIDTGYMMTHLWIIIVIVQIIFCKMKQQSACVSFEPSKDHQFFSEQFRTTRLPFGQQQGTKLVFTVIQELSCSSTFCTVSENPLCKELNRWMKKLSLIVTSTYKLPHPHS